MYMSKKTKYLTSKTKHAQKPADLLTHKTPKYPDPLAHLPLTAANKVYHH